MASSRWLRAIFVGSVAVIGCSTLVGVGFSWNLGEGLPSPLQSPWLQVDRLIRQGKIDQVIQRSWALLPLMTPTVDVYVDLSRALSDHGRWVAAADLLEQASLRRGTFPEVARNLAVANLMASQSEVDPILRRQRYQRAQQVVKRALAEGVTLEPRLLRDVGIPAPAEVGP